MYCVAFDLLKIFRYYSNYALKGDLRYANLCCLSHEWEPRYAYTDYNAHVSSKNVWMYDITSDVILGSRSTRNASVNCRRLMCNNVPSLFRLVYFLHVDFVISLLTRDKVQNSEIRILLRSLLEGCGSTFLYNLYRSVSQFDLSSVWLIYL